MTKQPADSRLITDTMVLPSDDVSRNNLLKFLRCYRYEECQRVCIFLKAVCEQSLNRADYVWIDAQLRMCLRQHNNGSDEEVFTELKYLQMRIDYLLSLGGLLL